jgi:hypothetical protein
MDFEGIVRDGVIVPTDNGSLPPEGTTVRITETTSTPAPNEPLKTFGEYFADVCGVIEGPEDLAEQHDHYRLGTPKR